MTKPYEISVVLTEHTTKKDLDPYADYEGVELQVAHTQVVHETTLSPAEECVGAGLSPIRTVQILSAALVAVVQAVGTADVSLSRSLVEAAISQIISDAPERRPPAEEFTDVDLTPEQRVSLTLLGRNPLYKKPQ